MSYGPSRSVDDVTSIVRHPVSCPAAQEYS